MFSPSCTFTVQNVSHLTDAALHTLSLKPEDEASQGSLIARENVEQPMTDSNARVSKVDRQFLM